MNTTYAFEKFELKRGEHIERYGVAGEGSLIAWRLDDAGELATLVVAWRGYGENRFTVQRASLLLSRHDGGLRLRSPDAERQPALPALDRMADAPPEEGGVIMWIELFSKGRGWQAFEIPLDYVTLLNYRVFCSVEFHKFIARRLTTMPLR